MLRFIERRSLNTTVIRFLVLNALLCPLLLLVLFPKSVLIFVIFYSIQKVTHWPITWPIFIHMLLFCGNKYSYRELVFCAAVKILLSFHFAILPQFFAHLSRVMTSAQSDQDPCCSLSVSLLIIGLISEQHGSWSDCADAQAGLDPCWSQIHNVGFVMTRLIYRYFVQVTSI
jgi:hypothetical protein